MSYLVCPPAAVSSADLQSLLVVLLPYGMADIANAEAAQTSLRAM